jgi:glycosyltransferase involved in cell wall biosynthesis
MRIAYVLTSLGVGGAERQAWRWRSAWRRAAMRSLSSCCAAASPKSGPPRSTPVRLEMRRTPASSSPASAHARRFLRDFQPDLIHSHTFPANMAARLLKISLPGAAVLSTVHNVYEGAGRVMLAYRLTDPLSRHTTAVSQAAADRYVRLKAVPARKSSVLTNGIDTTEFAPSPERRARHRRWMGVGEEFIWLAWPDASSRPRTIPTCCAPLPRSAPLSRTACLWIAGEARRRWFRGIQAWRLSSGDSVRWLGLRRDMPALLDAADGFVLASAWEGMPLAVGEAMAMEKPVVATDVGGVRELVGEAGVIVPAKNPERLAEAMLEMMRRTDEERRAGPGGA